MTPPTERAQRLIAELMHETTVWARLQGLRDAAHNVTHAEVLAARQRVDVVKDHVLSFIAELEGGQP